MGTTPTRSAPRNTHSTVGWLSVVERSVVDKTLTQSSTFLIPTKVGETVFHVCFLMGTPIHMHLAKRMLKHFPLLLNDIYLSEEYYGENVLHMAAVAEVLKHHVMTCHEMS